MPIDHSTTGALAALALALAACASPAPTERDVAERDDRVEVAAQAKGFSGLAMNLSRFTYYSTDFPVIDQIKRASGWFTSGGGVFDTGEEDKLDLDANGWVKSLPAANDPDVRYRTITTIMFQGDGGAHPTGDYTVLYDGDGDIAYAGGRLVRHTAGRDTVNVTADELDLVISRINPDDHLRNIRVYPPGGVCSRAMRTVVASGDACADDDTFIPFETLGQTHTWYPKFLADLANVRAIRFMDWGNTNGSQLASWADRPVMSDAFWTTANGVPLGVMISLTNALNADPWITLPFHVTDDYARSAGKLLLQTMKSTSTVYVEYGNEPWNIAYPFILNFNYQLAQAEARWGATGDDWDKKYQWVANWNAMRAVQLCDLIRAELGAQASRVKCVLNGQIGNTWYTMRDALPCPKAINILGKSCATSIDAVAIAPYFGAYMATSAERRAVISSWFSHDIAYQKDRVFEEILAKDKDGNTVVPPLTRAGANDANEAGGALAETKIWMENYRRDIAHGATPKPILAYEGGQHLVNDPNGCADEDDACHAFETKWTTLFIAANHDDRMGQAYAQLMDDWQATEGRMFSAFNFVESYSHSGAWGLRESLFDPTGNGKWATMMKYKNTVGCWWGTKPGQCSSP